MAAGFSLTPDRETAGIVFDQYETGNLAGTWLGIYELDEDRLTICDNAPDMSKPRPRSFRGRGQPGYVTIHFTRQS